MIRLIGFMLIVAGSSAAGITLAAGVKRSLKQCCAMQNALEYMRSEIEFHLAPLDEILPSTAQMLHGAPKKVFLTVANSIRQTPGIPVGNIMRRAIRTSKEHVAPELAQILTELFDLLGKHDALAQIRAIELAETRLNTQITRIRDEKKERCRAYRTIGICAGLAIAVILI